jgi:hypothetical protein
MSNPCSFIMDPSARIENIILSRSSRGMDSVKEALPAGYCSRAAQLILDHKGVVVIGTGFPVAGSFETDGPIGAISLYKVLEELGYRPVFVCAPPLSSVLQNNFATYEFPVLGWQESLPLAKAVLKEVNPAIVVSIEQPGVTQNGRYYNMRQQDITDVAAKFDLVLQHCACPTIAFGDGGNEIGMGKISSQLASLPIISAITTCDELVIATVSNWGVYGVLTALSYKLQRDLLALFDPGTIMGYLIEHGAVDGITGRAAYSEDGFPLAIGLSIISQLREK